MPPGRKPRVLVPELADAIVNAIAIGATDKAAYTAAGVSHTAFYQWIEFGTDAPDATPPRKARSPYREFAERITRARGEHIVNHLACITRAAQGTVIEHYGPDGKLTSIERKGDGDWRASKYALTVADPTTYSERLRIEQQVSGPGGGPVVVATSAEAVAKAVATMSPDQLRALVGAGTDDLAPDPEGEDGSER